MDKLKNKVEFGTKSRGQVNRLLTGRELVARQPVGSSSHNGLGSVLDSAHGGATDGGFC